MAMKKFLSLQDGASDKFGPQYDPEDYMGGAEAGNRLQVHLLLFLFSYSRA